MAEKVTAHCDFFNSGGRFIGSWERVIDVDNRNVVKAAEIDFGLFLDRLSRDLYLEHETED